jgi:hypothetical protein
MKVWVAKARFEHETEGQVIGLYTSRRKATRAVLDYFDLRRGKWTPPDDRSTFEPLDYDWLAEAVESGASGSVARWRVQ